MVNLVICSAAEVDYTESLCWYAERSIEAASNFEEEFSNALSAISATPERFPRCDAEHRYYMLRRFPFRIVYRIYDAEIVVIAVAHGSRKPNFWTNR